MFGGLFKSDPAEGTRKRLQPIVDKINALEAQMQALSDDELQAKTAELQKRAQGGEDLDSVLPEAFALVREGSVRVLGLRPFDVQLMGGIVLHEGNIAEMRTGEGKTLVAVLPAFLNALSGKGVHVVTVNDYLARRDSEWVGQVHRFLGLTVGLIQSGMDEATRRKGYACDVTYVTNSELGFDYLRDNLSQKREDLVLRAPDAFHFCVIDEVDSILIDEARTPLIISGAAERPSSQYVKAEKLAGALVKDVHYTVDEKQKNILLTDEGYEAAEDVLQVPDLYDPKTQWAAFVINAIKAKEIFLKDVSYIVKNGEVIIVDEFTGRTMPGRRWSDGLHQAIEAKEGLKIQEETVTLASVSYQALFRGFPKLGGMTGTAATEANEFENTYGLDVVVIPTNREVKRVDNSDVVFRSEPGKWKAVVVEVERMVKSGRPVLVGTTSVERSEELAALLAEENIPCQVLNAKPENVERESEIVAQAGRKGMVTIATNMAGRGTDILLGGNPEYMAKLKLREMLMPRIVSLVESDTAPDLTSKKGVKSWKAKDDLFPCELSPETAAAAKTAVDAAVKAWGERSLTELEAEDRIAVACEKAPTDDEVLAGLREVFNAMEGEYKVLTDQAKQEVVAAGGLHVVGTERHESRRIDNQLRGRAGRQGDPGSTRFFLSLEDQLFRIFGGDRIKGMMQAFRVEDMPIESNMLTKSLDEAQKKVEAFFQDTRKNLFDYDQVVNTQRERVYTERRMALLAAADALDARMRDYAEQTADDVLDANIDPEVPVAEWPLDDLAEKYKQYCPLLKDLTGDELRKRAGSGGPAGVEGLRKYLRGEAVMAYETKRDMVNAVEGGLMTDASRYFLLRQIDSLWKEHLQALKFIQTAVGLRGYAQRDPLTEFKVESYELFQALMGQIRRNVIYNVYIFEPVKAADIALEKKKIEETQGAVRG
ncbi:unnamed protein product [Pedinophyceae sp. YPF-701]|nr:unnamed protein product [Pedinophyceae sp. YPF-701]